MQIAKRGLRRFFAKMPRVPEEVANYLTHAVGFALSIAGMHQLLSAANGRGTVGQVAGVAVFGGSLVLLYLTSTLYHAVRNPSLKGTFRMVDHATIYLLIAGTYTPISLALPNPWPSWMLSLIWGLAALGIFFKVIFGLKYERVSLFMYLAMGWLGLLVFKPLAERVTAGGMAWLIAGGLAYTVGASFYIRESAKYSHAVWHIFVVLGSALHYGAVIFYVVPLTF